MNENTNDKIRIIAEDGALTLNGRVIATYGKGRTIPGFVIGAMATAAKTYVGSENVEVVASYSDGDPGPAPDRVVFMCVDGKTAVFSGSNADLYDDDHWSHLWSFGAKRHDTGMDFVSELAAVCERFLGEDAVDVTFNTEIDEETA